ncbi:MAG: Rrf2 family transcriptional regulator, partial [Gemmatimonadota bacterium]
CEITLYDIKRVVDGTSDFERCASGLDNCSDDMPCPLHDAWKPIRERIAEYMKVTTLEVMAEAVARKRSLINGEGAKPGPTSRRSR